MKLTYQEIFDILRRECNISDFAYNDWPSNIDSLLGPIKELEQNGGEGDGSNWYTIKHFVNHDVYIKIWGYYTSYEGTEFQSWEENSQQVKPRRKIVTVYE